MQKGLLCKEITRSDPERLLKSGKQVLALKGVIEYPSPFADNVLVTTSGGTVTWNGSFSDIEELRCDGLVEVLYEKPGRYINHVWGKFDGGIWCYPISTYGKHHNKQNFINWHDTLVPATQSGHSFLFSNTQTHFTRVHHVVEPAILD